MSKLISMERPKPVSLKAEAKICEPCSSDGYYEKYPYGLRISLRNEDLEKLGVDVAAITAGDIGTISAKIVFTEVQSRDTLDDKGASKKNNSVEMQITDLEINSDDFDSSFKEATKGD